MGIKPPLVAAWIIGLIFKGIIGADADLKMKMGISGGSRLSHDANLGSAGDGVPLGIAGNEVVGAGSVGGGFVVPQVEIPGVEFRHTLVVVGQSTSAQFGDVVFQNDDISA